MTSNDVSALPPELTRAGRLDAHWYFTLPTEEERHEIFQIHFRKVGRTLTDDVLEAAVNSTNNYTGAEIEEVVKVSMRKAFKRFKEDGNRDIVMEDVVESSKEVIPLYSSSREKIAALDIWSNGRVRRTNYETVATSYNENTDSDLLGDLLSLKQ